MNQESEKMEARSEGTEILMEEYFSFVKHELRTQMTVIREVVSQILDSKGKKEWKDYSELLTLALECTDKLNALIGETLTVPALEEFKEK